MIVLIRKNVLLSLILFVCMISVQAQDDPYRAEVGFQTGMSLYSGDVNSVADLNLYSRNLKNIRADFGLIFRYRFNQRLALRMGYDYTKVKGGYTYRSGTENFTANLDNPLHMAEIRGEFNFFDLENNPYKRFSKKYTPFIFAGTGMIFVPKYRSLESNSNKLLSIPLGVGFKWKMAEKLNFNIVYTHRWIAGDFLEGKPEFDNPVPKTVSNPINYDRLSEISIGFTYDFWVRNCDCPGGTFGKGQKPVSQKNVKQKNRKKSK